MSNSIDLSVSRSLELLGSLVRTGSDYVKKEDQLARALNSRRFGAVRQYREMLESVGKQLAEQTATVHAHFTERERVVREIHEGRRAHLEKLSSFGLRDIPKRAQEAKERWLGDLQMRQFNGDRKQGADQAAADAVLAKVLEELAQERTLLVRLQKNAWRCFFGYWTFLRLLRNNPATVTAAAEEQEPLFAELRAKLATIQKQIFEFRKRLLPSLFSNLPLPALILLIAAGCGGLAYAADEAQWRTIAWAGGGLVALVWGIHTAGLFQAGPAVGEQHRRSVALARPVPRGCRSQSGTGTGGNRSGTGAGLGQCARTLANGGHRGKGVCPEGALQD